MKNFFATIALRRYLKKNGYIVPYKLKVTNIVEEAEVIMGHLSYKKEYEYRCFITAGGYVFSIKGESNEPFNIFKSSSFKIFKNEIKKHFFKLN